MARPPAKGRPPVGAAAARGHNRLQPSLKGCRPRPGCKGRLPAARPQGATASDQPCRLRRGSGDGGAKGGKERARASF
ncbi:hypothetical protein BHM03_00035624 [Ensete ventricosum]|nr:hypothetical protein BHM03_00035624 [Ensete ventricosum]